MTDRADAQGGSASTGDVRPSVLQDAEQLLKGITKGEWRYDHQNEEVQAVYGPIGEFVIICTPGAEHTVSDNHDGDMAFIAAAPRLVRDLLALLPSQEPAAPLKDEQGPTIAALVLEATAAAEALRLVDFNNRTQRFVCRQCEARNPMGLNDDSKLHGDGCPVVPFVTAMGKLHAFATGLPNFQSEDGR